MGPNGSGKSTLANTLLANPHYRVTEGRVLAPRRRRHPPPHRRARRPGHVPRLPAPRGDPGRQRVQLPAPGARGPQGHPRPLGARGAPRAHGVDEAPRHVRRASPSATSTRASRAARRSATRSSRWRSWSPTSRCSTRPTRASTSTRCAPWPSGIAEIRAARPELAILLITHYQRILEHLTPRRRARAPRRAHRRHRRPRARAAHRGRGVRVVRDRRAGGLRWDLDVARIKADFPILKRQVQRQAARLPRLRVVVAEADARARRDGRALPDVLRQHPPRRLHDRRGVDRGVRARTRERRALHRRRVGRARSCSRKNITEAINLFAYSWARTNLSAGDARALPRWSTTRTSCRGTSSPRSAASSCAGCRSTTTTGSTSRELDRLLDGAKLFAFTAMSNVLGTVNDVARARRRRATPPARPCSSTPPRPFRTPRSTCRRGTPTSSASPATRCSARAASAGFWARPELLEAMPPFLGGGEMILDVRKDGYVPNEVPWKFEAGTMPIAEATGLGAAVDYLERLGIDAVHEHEQRLTGYTLARPARPLRRAAHDPRAPAASKRRGGDRLVPVRRHPRPRHLAGPRRGRRLRARQPPLRQAADARARCPGHHPGVVLPVQRRGRRRRARRRPRTTPRSSSPI